MNTSKFVSYDREQDDFDRSPTTRHQSKLMQLVRENHEPPWKVALRSTTLVTGEIHSTSKTGDYGILKLSNGDTVFCHMNDVSCRCGNHMFYQKRVISAGTIVFIPEIYDRSGQGDLQAAHIFCANCWAYNINRVKDELVVETRRQRYMTAITMEGRNEFYDKIQGNTSRFKKECARQELDLGKERVVVRGKVVATRRIPNKLIDHRKPVEIEEEAPVSRQVSTEDKMARYAPKYEDKSNLHKIVAEHKPISSDSGMGLTKNPLRPEDIQRFQKRFAEKQAGGR